MDPGVQLHASTAWALVRELRSHKLCDTVGWGGAFPITPGASMLAREAWEGNTAPRRPAPRPGDTHAYLGQIHPEFELRNEVEDHTALVLHDAQFCLFLIFSVAFLIFGQNQFRA